MKYGYSEGNSSLLIRNYQVKGNRIVITHLDGTSYEIPFTEENEQEILDKMLSQALDRENSGAIANVKKEMTKAVFWNLLDLFIMINSIAKSSVPTPKALQILNTASGTLAAILFVWTGIRYKNKADELNELKKYQIYLSIINELENSQDPNLLYGININGKALSININTIDKFTLDDLKKIKANLERSNEYSRMLKK